MSSKQFVFNLPSCKSSSLIYISMEICKFKNVCGKKTCKSHNMKINNIYVHVPTYVSMHWRADGQFLFDQNLENPKINTNFLRFLRWIFSGSLYSSRQSSFQFFFFFFKKPYRTNSTNGLSHCMYKRPVINTFRNFNFLILVI